MQPRQAFRRSVAGLLFTAAVLLAGCSQPEPAPPQPSAAAVVSVADFGARGDGVTDDRPSIQAALDHAGSNGSSIYFPPGIFRLATASAPQNRILITQANQNLVGAGSKVSRLLVGTSFGAYVTVIGAARDSLGTGSWSMTELAIDQNARSNNALDVEAMHQSPKMALRLGDYGSSSEVTVSRSIFSDSDSLNTLYLYGAKVTVANTQFLIIGGLPGRPVHDHSTIYTTATTDNSIQDISNNTFAGVRSSAGSATAIETHGGVQSVANNLISDYLRGFNVTGVAGVRTTAARISGNIVNRASIGVQLWSETTPTSDSSGLTNVEVTNNAFGLDGAAWRIGGVMAPTAGVLITTSNTAAIDGLTIASNQIRYVSVNPAAQVRPDSAGVACRVTAVDARPRRVVIVDNVFDRAPAAVDGSCVVDGALVRGNRTSG